MRTFAFLEKNSYRILAKQNIAGIITQYSLSNSERKAKNEHFYTHWKA